MIRLTTLLCAFPICSLHLVFSQPVPAEDENIPYLVTFGAASDKSWGDDDFCQTFFFMVPPSHTSPFYIRVFDPDTGGELDEMKGEFNTTTRISIFGGNGAWSNEDARDVNPIGNYRSGNQLATKNFSKSNRYDEEWYTFGPFIQQEGEFVEKLGGHIFKVIVQGIAGDDGNLYRFYMSTDKSENRAIEGGNVFTYEYTFRLSNNQYNVSQIYPFLDDKVTSVKIQNFDWDGDGFIRVVSVAKRGELCTISSDVEWKENEFVITKSELNTSMEIQFIKSNSKLVKNNNVVVIVQNQYGENVPFFVIPIGGKPVYNPSLRMKAIER
ncbi:MAG: hypothetical protein GY790_18880 [Bacteroidetes bacterium]|nr:hypothetical protein [Bacteroidota bacterium]